jgi:hypothetical protein
MTRLGTTLRDVWETQKTPDPDEVKAVGKALAEFVVEFRKKTGGLIHQDLHFGNVTQQPNGRYGCIDFECCPPGTLEMAFIALAREEKTNILPAASGRIRELTGKPLDAEKIRQDAITSCTQFFGSDPKVIANIERNCGGLAKASTARPGLRTPGVKHSK